MADYRKVHPFHAFYAAFGLSFETPPGELFLADTREPIAGRLRVQLTPAARASNDFLHIQYRTPPGLPPVLDSSVVVKAVPLPRGRWALEVNDNLMTLDEQADWLHAAKALPGYFPAWVGRLFEQVGVQQIVDEQTHGRFVLAEDTRLKKAA